MRERVKPFKRVRLQWAGIGLGILYWFIESLIDSFLFHQGSVAERIFAPDPNELWMRLLVVSLLIILGFYSQLLIEKRDLAEEEVRKINKDLDLRVIERTAQLETAEGALKAERDKFMNILESMGDGIYIGNQDYDVEYINPVIEREFGPVGGRKCYEYFHDRDEVCPWCRNEEVFAGKTVRWEWYFTKNKKTYDLLNTPLLNQDGTISNLEIFRDITERRQAEAEIENSLSLLHATLESTADGILAVDNEGKITSFNKRFVDMWRIPESIVSSRDDNQALAFVLEQLKDQEVFLAKVKELYSQPYVESDDVLEFKDGRVFERYSRPQLIGGKNVGRVWSFRDVTERIKMEKELVYRSILATELVRMNKMKSQFLANVSHELRTPLNSILGFSELMIEKSFGGLNEKQTQYINYINQSGHHLLRLINNILDMSKVESGRVELEPEEFLLTDAIGEVLNIIGPMAHKKSVVIESKTTHVSPTVILDRAKFKQIMLNLISNAVKFNKKGGKVDIDWDISEEAKGDIKERVLRISVKDTGIGIKNQDIPRLFRDFEQLDSSVTREYGGTGLGMALTKKLIELHGGRIWVESEYGKGTKFSFVIPLDKRADFVITRSNK